MTFATRVALPADHPSLVALFAELGVPDPVPDRAAFEAMLPRLVVATDGSRVVGYASWRIYDDVAHVVNVVTAPDMRGKGVGQTLMDAVRVGARRDGARDWYLNVKIDNAAAIRLYERCGLSAGNPAWAIEGAWSIRANLPAPNFATRVDDRAEAHELKALGLLPAMITALGARGRVLVGLRDPDGTLVAFAAFDPLYPGAYPFVARDVGLARALLDALYPHRDARHGELVRVALESDRRLADALVAAGGRLLFALVRMHGPLS